MSPALYCIGWQSKVTGIEGHGSEQMDLATARRRLDMIEGQPWARVADFKIVPATARKVYHEQRQGMLALDY